jgi:uncharacterized SAM-binding protein YcdF (DUF218 family)
MIKSIIQLVFHPIFLFFVFITFSWFMARKPKWQNLLRFTAFAWLFLIYVSPFSFYLIQSKEHHYRPLSETDIAALKKQPEVHILILGSGITNDPRVSTVSKLGGTVLFRLSEGMVIYNQLDNAKIITSGAKLGRHISQAEAVANAAVSLGVNPKDTMHLPNTINTENELKSYFKRFGKKYPLLISTDALHIPRAMKWAENNNLNAFANPCNYLYLEDPDKFNFMWFPRYGKGKLYLSWLVEELGYWEAEIKKSLNKA